jgi:hypothetical protein
MQKARRQPIVTDLAINRNPVCSGENYRKRVRNIYNVPYIGQLTTAPIE